MLYRHVVALLDQRVLQIAVRSWSNSRLRWSLLEVAGQSLILESALGGVEHDGVLEVFVSWLGEGAWSLLLAIDVLAWAWDIEFQRLTVVSLVEVESWRGGIETNFLSNLLLEITCSSLANPVALTIRCVSETSNLILNAKLSLVLHHDLSVKSLSHELLSWHTFRS